MRKTCLSRPIFFLFPPNSQLIPKCTKHCVFTGKCNLCASRPIFFYSLIRNLFQTAKNIVFSQVNAACVSRPIFSYFPNSQLIPTCAKHCVFTGRCACLSRPIFFYSLIRNLFLSAQNIVFSHVSATFVLRVPFFSIP